MKKTYRLRVVLAVAAAVAGASLLSTVPAQAFGFVVPGIGVPSQVIVGQIGPATIGLSNASTAGETFTATDIDVVPACSNTSFGCPGGIEAGVFQLGSATGSGPVTCAGSWTITQTGPGTFRFEPPGGHGTVFLVPGDLCQVDFHLTALRVPTVDTNPAPGTQTSAVISAVFVATGGGAVGNSSNTITTVLPAPPQAPPADFDGDVRSDVTVYRPGTGVWYVARSTGGNTVINWGSPGDVPAVGDYDADNLSDYAVFRPSTAVWYVNRSAGGTTILNWGSNGDIPMAQDYDGDRQTDIAVYRPSTGVWYISRSGGGTTVTNWGSPGDIPAAGDFDGDRKADLAVFRPSTAIWYIQRSAGGTTILNWGSNGDIPKAGDFDLDGRTDIAVYRPSNAVWYVSRSGGGTTVVNWGSPGDQPEVGDYDGDGQSDFAVFRPSTGIWYVNRSTAGLFVINWGSSGDVPIGPPPS